MKKSTEVRKVGLYEGVHRVDLLHHLFLNRNRSTRKLIALVLILFVLVPYLFQSRQEIDFWQRAVGFAPQIQVFPQSISPGVSFLQLKGLSDEKLQRLELSFDGGLSWYRAETLMGSLMRFEGSGTRFELSLPLSAPLFRQNLAYDTGLLSPFKMKTFYLRGITVEGAFTRPRSVVIFYERPEDVAPLDRPIRRTPERPMPTRLPASVEN